MVSIAAEDFAREMAHDLRYSVRRGRRSSVSLVVMALVFLKNAVNILKKLLKNAAKLSYIFLKNVLPCACGYGKVR